MEATDFRCPPYKLADLGRAGSDSVIRALGEPLHPTFNFSNCSLFAF